MYLLCCWAYLDIQYLVVSARGSISNTCVNGTIKPFYTLNTENTKYKFKYSSLVAFLLVF